MNAQTERLVIAGPAGDLALSLDAAAHGLPARGLAVIAHPHPLFGGTMDNKVVQTLARAFLQSGWVSIRFNFRGVGASEGQHDHGVGEAQDALALIAQLAPQGPLALAGFSFGAFVTSHVIAALHPAREIEQIVLVGQVVAQRVAACAPPPAAVEMPIPF